MCRTTTVPKRPKRMAVRLAAGASDAEITARLSVRAATVERVTVALSTG